MPKSTDSSSFEGFLSLIKPLINTFPPKTTLSRKDRQALLPKEGEYTIYGFFEIKKELNFINRRHGYDEKKPVTADNYQGIYATMMRHHVYLELTEPELKYLPAKDLMAKAIEDTSTLITTSSGLIPDLAKISAEYLLTETDMRKALTLHGVFNTKPESKIQSTATTDSPPHQASKSPSQ